MYTTPSSPGWPHAETGSRSQPALCAASCEGPLCLDTDELFYFLLVAYRRYGGLARRTEVEHRFPAALQGPTLHLTWCNDSWYPLAQFHASGTGLRTGFQCALAELDVLPPARAALWFVEPSPWLAQWRPIDLIDLAPARVHEAARVERFVARG